jgi:hypothetical protein
MAKGLAGYATQVDPVNDIVCAYTTSPTQLPADGVSGAVWQVIGEFDVPTAVACRLVALACTSNTGLELQVKLYNPAAVAESLLSVSSTEMLRVRSQVLNLVPGVTYQIASRCNGVADPLSFAVVRHAYIGAQ